MYIRAPAANKPNPYWFALYALLTAILASACAQAPKSSAPLPPTNHASEYRIQPGDRLFISVWREEALQRPVLVGPDGSISFTLAGQIQGTGMSLKELEKELQKRLIKYIPEAAVSVSLVETLGNKIYIAGKVIRPGEYVISRPTNVMQAIALAGGITPFADKTNIKVLRAKNGNNQVYWFNYKQVANGENLSQNITLAPGDTVVVP